MSTPKTDLARVWADAIPLYEFLAERAEREPRKSSVPAEVAGSMDDPVSKDPTIRALRHMAHSLDQSTQRNAAFAKAQKTLLNELIAGRVACLGREPKSYHFERVHSSFWIGAKVDWFSNTVQRDEQRFVELRVTLDVLSNESPESPESGSDSDSIRAAILAAIKHHAELNEDPRLRRPPIERYRTYRTYIASLGYNPRKERGFSDKNFEKYETEFRKTFK